MAQSMVQYVGFSLLCDEDNERNSHAVVESGEVFTPTGDPISGGVWDMRMGTTDQAKICLTCRNGKKLCPGHRGSIRLPVSLAQPICTAEIRKWLRLVCFNCGSLVVEASKVSHIPMAKRLAKASTIAAEGKECPKCKTPHPKIIKDDDDYYTFIADESTGDGSSLKVRNKLHPDRIRYIFNKVSDAAVESMGKNLNVHPRNLFIKIVNVPPNTIRPPNMRSMSRNLGGASQDSNNILRRIAKSSGQITRDYGDYLDTYWKESKPDEKLIKSIQTLQELYYDMIMGSSSTSVTQGNSGKRGIVVGTRPVQSFMRVLARKEGLIRSALLGKRVIYISRSTISGNMRFKIDEVGLPLEFARTLQVKEVVQEYNKDWLMTFFLNGRKRYPGCTYIVLKNTGEVNDVSNMRNFRLEVGDVMFRDVIDGDLAIFNRQPTLERSSVGVHKVIVIQDPSVHTFQINVLACVFYNADFDGDQMHLSVVRNPASRAEASILSGVANWFISTKSSGPVNGQVQDSVIGCYELTRNITKMDKYHAMSLFSTTGLDPPRFDTYPADHIYSGRDIISILLSDTPINYKKPPGSYSDVYTPYIDYDPTEMMTTIERGKMTSGVLDSRSVGGKPGGIFHIIGREFGSQKALDMIFATQQIALQILMYRGFTVGTSDLLIPKEAVKKVHSLVSAVVVESRVVTDRLIRGEIVPPIGKTIRDFYEKQQIETLKVPESEILRWTLGTVKPESNGLFRMVSTGAKGNNANFIHIAGVIGQTTINGTRIEESFAFRRTLPYFPRFSTDPRAYGFVTNNYISGMTVPEYIFQSMNSRVDLISKALSTASTGYFMRKGVMNNQSSIVDNFRRVVKDTKIVQLIYGEDGLDSRELERVEFPTVLMSDDDVKKMCWIKVEESGDHQSIVDDACNKIVDDRDSYRKIFSRVERSNLIPIFSTSMLMPVNVRRIIESSMTAASDRSDPIPNVTGKSMVEKISRVSDLCDRLPYVFINEIQERKRSPVPPHISAACSLMCMIVRAELNPLVLSKITNEQLDFIVDAIRQRYSSSTIDYGTAAGILAAQSISEPLTQYMLDSHHRSVVGGTSKSGLNRVIEIYGAKGIEDEQSSEMLLPLIEDGMTIEKAKSIANNIEYVNLRMFVEGTCDRLLEPYGRLSYPPFASDKIWIESFEKNHPLIKVPNDLTNWCFRFPLSKSSMVLKAIDLERIIQRLSSAHPTMHIVHTQESVQNIVIRGWYRSSQFKKYAPDEARMNKLMNSVLDTPIRGIKGIMNATASTIPRMRINVDGSLEKYDKIVIKTVGTNLYHSALNKFVDTKELISTSIGDTYQMLGIEAARTKIVNETRSLLSQEAPNMRHLYIYADELTRTGKVTSIEPGGLGAREHNNVFLRMAYCDPKRAVTGAVLAGTKSKIYGIAAPQLLGTMPLVGSTYNELVIDEEFVHNNIKSVDSILDSI